MSLLVDALGRDMLERLSLILGGQRLRVPQGLDRGRAPVAFAKRVGGEDIAVRLILHFSDSSVYVPLLERAQAGGPERITVRKVMSLTRRKLSANEIAKRLSCSVRVVYRKRAKHRARELDRLGAKERKEPAHEQRNPA
jgi:hypothetical protein